MPTRFCAMLCRFSWAPVVALGCFAQASFASAAPAQLYNKSINFAWTMSATQRGPDGRTTTPQINVTRTVYVSSAGRLFIRGSASVRGQIVRKKEIAPGGGSAGTLAFQGSQLIGTVPFQNAAQRIMVSFNSGFTICNATVVIGRVPGSPKWVGFDGVTYEILSTSVGAASCSISEGNALAN